MGKGSLAKIAAALAIISVYIYLFGIMGTIDSLETNLPQQETAETEEAEEVMAEIPLRTSASTSAPVSTEAVTNRTVYTYETELNVINGKKPYLADYTATEPLMIIEEISAPAAAAVTTGTDFAFEEEDFDYTTPKKTSATTTTTPPQTTTTAPVTTTPATTTSLTTAATQIITVPTTTTTEMPWADFITSTTTLPPETTTTTTEETTTTTTTEVTTTTEATTTTELTTTEITSITDPPSWMNGDAEETTAETTTETTTAAPAPDVSGEMVTVNAGGTITTDYASVIVAKAVMAEVGDSFDEDAIKAQAIATYTYIKYYNQNKQNAYVVFKTPSDKVTRCVNEVMGLTIKYDGKLIQSVYSASSAGYTASSKNVWGVDYPYLRSVKTEFDALYDINYGRTATFTSDEIKTYLTNAGIAVSGDPSTWLSITSRIDGNFVGSMNICGAEQLNGKTISGRMFRENIMKYGIRSASFDVSYNSADDTFTFTTYGYGHSVGMSQHGANILATQYNYSYIDILKFYYQGVEIS